MVNILLAILVFSIIIIVHEFGHYIVAKANGVMVLEFCIGFGPRLVHFTKGETMYSIKLIPFGGACIMLGEDDGLDEIGNSRQEGDGKNRDGDLKAADGSNAGSDERADQHRDASLPKYDPERSFANKSVWARIAIVVAGPLFNFLLAFIFAVIIIGSVGYDPCTVDIVYDNSPAAEAGLMEGDVITKINGRSITFAREFNLYRNLYPDKDLEITYRRNGETYTTTVSLRHTVTQAYQVGVQITTDNIITYVQDDSPAKEAGFKINDKVYSVNGRQVSEKVTFGDLIRSEEGAECKVVVIRDDKEVSLAVTPRLTDVEDYYSGFACYGNREKVSPIETVGYGFQEIGYWIRYVFDSLGMLFRGQVGLDDVSGPVGVVSVIGQVVEQSKPDGAFYVMLNLLNMAVLISANLGVMNLLPIPAIDGGRLVFLIIEAVRGKPVSKEKEGMIHMIGMILLMILMFVILFNDIRKLF